MIRKLFKNHTLLMVVCCLIPVIAIGIFLTVGFKGQAFFFLLILLCPLAHLFLMKDHGDHKQGLKSSLRSDLNEKGDTKRNGKHCH